MNEPQEPMDGEQASPNEALNPAIKQGEHTGIQSPVFDLCHSYVPYGTDFESNFCDFVELPNTKIRVVIGDILALWKLVGDHIVEPDILRKIKPTIRQFLESETEVSEVTDKLNKFFAGMKNELVVTCLVLQIDPNSTDLQIVNAGSEFPLFNRKGAAGFSNGGAFVYRGHRVAVNSSWQGCWMGGGNRTIFETCMVAVLAFGSSDVVQ